MGDRFGARFPSPLHRQATSLSSGMSLMLPTHPYREHDQEQGAWDAGDGRDASSRLWRQDI